MSSLFHVSRNYRIGSRRCFKSIDNYLSFRALFFFLFYRCVLFVAFTTYSVEGTISFCTLRSLSFKATISILCQNRKIQILVIAENRGKIDKEWDLKGYATDSKQIVKGKIKDDDHPLSILYQPILGFRLRIGER